MEKQQVILNWITAIGTLLSALVALFVVLYTVLKSKFNKAIFEVKNFVINPQIGNGSFFGDGIPEERDSAVEIKLEIKQIAGGIASNVEVILKNIWRYNENGQKEKWPYYIPTNLTWGNREKKTITQRFSKGLSRYCNIGVYGMDSEDNYMLEIATAEEIGDTYTDMLSEYLPIGKYEFEIAVNGDNVVSLDKMILVEVVGGWRSNCKESFDNLLKIEIS